MNSTTNPNNHIFEIEFFIIHHPTYAQEVPSSTTSKSFVKISSSDSSDVNKFKPTGINIRQKLISQVYASLDAMNADLSQSVGTYGFLYSLTASNMIGVYRFDGEKWVEKVMGDYTGTVTPTEYDDLNDLADEINGEIIEE